MLQTIKRLYSDTKHWYCLYMTLCVVCCTFNYAYVHYIQMVQEGNVFKKTLSGTKLSTAFNYMVLKCWNYILNVSN
jgi:hypothetical protein